MTTADLPFPRTQREFYEMFRTDDDCIEYMFTMRWPNGFECPHCGGREYWDNASKHYAVKCAKCGRDISMLAGTGETQFIRSTYDNGRMAVSVPAKGGMIFSHMLTRGWPPGIKPAIPPLTNTLHCVHLSLRG